MLASEKVKPFRVAESPIQIECKVNEIIELGTEGGAGNLIICEVLKKVVDNGLPGKHYFLIGFLTKFPGVKIAKHLLEKYPEEMTIGIDASATGDIVSIVLTDLEILLPLGSLVDINQEIERLEKELQKLQGEIKRATGMLSNPNFTSKAPEAKVNAEKEKLENYKEQFNTVENRLEELKK